VHAKVIAVVNVGECRGTVVGVIHARTLPPVACGSLLYNSYSVGPERLLYSVAQYARYELTPQPLLNRRFSRYRRPDASIPPDMCLCNVSRGWPLRVAILAIVETIYGADGNTVRRAKAIGRDIGAATSRIPQPIH
jgi:hypothetical protein